MPTRSRMLMVRAAVLALLVAAAPARAQHDHGAGQAAPAAAPRAERYYCPMHCEGEKTYPKAGRCPVCKMSLRLQTSEDYTASVREADDADLEAGKPASLEFRIKSPTGMPVTNFEVVHEKALHLLVVSKDLSWFRHEHPVMGPDGTFSLAFTFPTGGTYNIYHNFTPTPAAGAAGPGEQAVRVAVKVKGDAPAGVALAPDAALPKTVDGYTVTLDGGQAIRAGGSAMLTFTIAKDAKPVTTLAPYLGALGHLVVISENGEEFVHSHPVGGHEGHAMTGGGPSVAFEAHFKKPGVYRAWGQFNVGTKDKEQILSAPFTFKVEAEGTAHDSHEHK